MSEPRFITAADAKALLDATGLRGCDLEHLASYDPEEKYTPGARSLVYIDGWEDVDGGGNYQQTGGSICDGVPEDVAPLFAAAPDLAHTVVEQYADIVDLYEEVNDYHYDLLRVMEERNQLSEQIRRVWELLDQMAEDDGRVADSLGSEYARGKHYAYANAAKFIREAIGDTDG